ncbi:MAG TPA: zf-HC2 domain-containing protein [Vicinamibacterales bacterium]|nr:zf-HC2 domain-containing protein [Vicinamibacterales bacterium]
MTDITCTFAGDREQTLIAYLYDDIDPADRAAFDAHLPTCARCRRDLASLSGVRQQLARWQPPLPQLPSSDRAPVASHRWRQLPAWAQVAAALLFLGVSAAIANLDVRYDASGLSVRTGWSRPSPDAARGAGSLAAAVVPAAQPVRPADMATHDDLTALEQRLRAEIKGASVAAPQAARAASADADTLRRVRALVDESEKREQRELALRVAQVLRDVNAQRQADLSKIDRNLGLIQNSTGVEILKQREMVNYLMRVSQRQ